MTGPRHKPMSMSGFCRFPSSLHDSHVFCKRPDCMCACHKKKR